LAALLSIAPARVPFVLFGESPPSLPLFPLSIRSSPKYVFALIELLCSSCFPFIALHSNRRLFQTLPSQPPSSFTPPALCSSPHHSTPDVFTPSAAMDSSPFYNQNHNNPRFKEGHASYITTVSSATSFYPPSDWASTPLPLPRPNRPSPQASFISSSSSGSAYTNTTRGTQGHNGSQQHLGGGRPPLPQFPASFQKHFAASPRKDRTPPPLDLSEARISPQKKRENHPTISTTPSPRMTSYGSMLHANVAARPSQQQRRSSLPFTPVIPISPQTPLLPSPLSRTESPSSYNTTTNMDSDPDAYVAPPITPSRLKRFSRRWGLEGDEAKEVEKARKRVDREMASLEKERKEMKKFEKEENQWEKERRRQAEEELEGALRVWSPLRFGRGGESEKGGGGLNDSQRSYGSSRGGGGNTFMCFGSRGGKGEKTGNGELDEKKRKKKRLIWVSRVPPSSRFRPRSPSSLRLGRKRRAEFFSLFLHASLPDRSHSSHPHPHRWSHRPPR